MQRPPNQPKPIDPTRLRDAYALPLKSPITPAMTGLSFPSPSETRSERERNKAFAMLPDLTFSTGHSSSDGSIEPATPTDHASLDQLWSSIRQQKEKKMAKEAPKVESFAGPSISFNAQAIGVAPARPTVSQRPSLKSQKSISAFHESSDGRMMTATFKIPGLKKQDIHVSYQKNRLNITWEVVEVTESEEGGRSERREKYSRSIPLPEGTKFSEVRAAMDGRYLILKYPNVRSA